MKNTKSTKTTKSVDPRFLTKSGKRNHNLTMNEVVSKQEAKFYAERAKKIAASRAANKAAGFTEREKRAIARADREFLLSVA